MVSISRVAPSSRSANERPRVDVVVNPAAGQLGESSALRSLFLAARSRGAHVSETTSPADLDEVARAIAARGTDCVVLAGGDGSHMAGVTALRRAFGDDLPPIVLAPGGTMGTVARNWGMRGSKVAYAERALESALSGTIRVTPRPSLHVRDDAGGDRVGFIFGAGLVANFFEIYDAAPSRGIGAAAAIAARVFAGSLVGGALAKQILAPAPAVVHVDGVAQTSRAWSLLLASVVRDVGLHMLVAHRAGEEIERFHVVASALPPRALAPQLPRVLAGRTLQGDGHVDAMVSDLHVELTGARGTYILDGEAFRARDVRVNPGPVLRIVDV